MNIGRAESLWIWMARRHRRSENERLTRTTLKAILDGEHIDPASYTLEGGMPNERFVLSHDPSEWCVYYSERGYCNDRKSFATEHDACSDLLRRLRSSRTATSR